MGANIRWKAVLPSLTVSEASQGLRSLRRIFAQARGSVLLQVLPQMDTTVDEIGYVERGYENFEEKLRSLGAVIERVDLEKEAQKFRLRVG